MSDLLCGKLFAAGHFQIAGVPHRPDQQALLHFARKDGGAGFAPLQQGGAAIEPQPALLFFIIVAFGALAGEEGADSVFKMVFGGTCPGVWGDHDQSDPGQHPPYARTPRIVSPAKSVKW